MRPITLTSAGAASLALLLALVPFGANHASAQVTRPPLPGRPHPRISPHPTPTPCGFFTGNMSVPPDLQKEYGPFPDPNTITPPPESYIPPPPAPDPSAAAGDTSAGEAGAEGSGLPVNPSASPNACPSPEIGNGDLLNRLYQAASQFRGSNTEWPGTGCSGEPNGTCACAAAVGQVFVNAVGNRPAGYGVDEWRDLALSGKYGGNILTPATVALAHKGAVIIWPQAVDPSAGHIGFCAVDGCSITWSNHSGDPPSDPSRFAWGLSGPIEGSTYLNYSSFLVWEPAHVP